MYSFFVPASYSDRVLKQEEEGNVGRAKLHQHTTRSKVMFMWWGSLITRDCTNKRAIRQALDAIFKKASRFRMWMVCLYFTFYRFIYLFHEHKCKSVPEIIFSLLLPVLLDY